MHDTHKLCTAYPCLKEENTIKNKKVKETEKYRRKKEEMVKMGIVMYILLVKSRRHRVV